MSTLSVRAVRVAPARHPEWWVYAVAAAAGLVLLDAAVEQAGSGASAMHGMHGMQHGVGGSALTGLDHWFLMVLAMMLPMVAPQARTVAMRSLWRRRQRAVALFVLGHVAVWLLVGAAVVGLTALLASWTGQPAPWLVPALLVVAAAWQVSSPRRRAMRRCGAVRLRAADGVTADVDCARLGAGAGLLCVVSCGAVMLPMAVDPGAAHSLPLMAALLAILLWERAAGPNPATRPGRPHEALALLALAAATGSVALAPLLA